VKRSVSIALAAFKGERFIAQQLESFGRQTRLPDEVVVSDDQSPDKTLEVIQTFASSAPFPVKIVVNQQDHGVNGNFENAVRNCQHEIILFSDQDDVWLPEHVAKLAQPLEEDPALTLVVSNSRMVNQQLAPLDHTSVDAYRLSVSFLNQTNRANTRQFELFARHRMFLGHGMAFRSAILPYLLPFTPNCGYDEWVALLAAAAGRMLYIEEPLTLYRIHQSQVSANKKHSIFQTARAHFQALSSQEEEVIAKWLELKQRILAFPDFVPNAAYVISVFDDKLDFLNKRKAIRRSSFLPRCYKSVRELIRGSYHRSSRGLLSFGRDLLSNRQKV
jgi:glycosyltransferase involved in cell wall biosynthesis